MTQRNDSRSDEELVRPANEGDPAAFEALYRRYREWVMATAQRLTGDRDVAADVMQETFLYLLRKFPGFELTARFKTFLYPVVRHTAVGLAERRRREAPATDPDRVPIDPAPAGPQADLAALVESLPAGQREVLILRFAEGLSLQEIATAMQLPLGTIKSRLHNALSALRRDERTRKYLDD